MYFTFPNVDVQNEFTANPTRIFGMHIIRIESAFYLDYLYILHLCS